MTDNHDPFIDEHEVEPFHLEPYDPRTHILLGDYLRQLDAEKVRQAVERRERLRVTL